MLSTLNRSWEFNCNINKDTWFGFSLDLFCLCSTLETLTLQREQKMRQTQTNTKSQSFFFFLKHEQILTYATSTLYGKCVDRRSKIICQKSEFECVPYKVYVFLEISNLAMMKMLNFFLQTSEMFAKRLFLQSINWKIAFSPTACLSVWQNLQAPSSWNLIPSLSHYWPTLSFNYDQLDVLV